MKNKFYRIAVFWSLLAAVFVHYAQQSSWKKLNTPVSVTLKYLCFIDSLNGWAAGESGTIIHTTDGGESWQVQNSTVSSFIVDIFFVDEYTGRALTVKEVFPFNTIILKTTNGGGSWLAEDFQDTTTLMRTIFFHDTLNGFIGGNYIAYTSDGGNSWVKALVDSNMVSNFPVYNFSFFNKQFGYACGGVLDNAGVIWRTTNYGLNWTAQGVSADQVYDIAVLDSLNAIALSGDPEGFFPTRVIKTTNAGITWEFEEMPFSDLSFSIDFRTANEGWSASGFRFLFTTDRGENWNVASTPDTAVVFDLQFTDARTGYAAGPEGVILKLNPATVNADHEEDLPAEILLGQNYPNPFNSTTKIKFTIPIVIASETKQSHLVILKVYNVLGSEVAILVDEFLPSGIYKYEFNAMGLPSGVYFYRLQAGSFTQTKKMLLIK